MPVIDNFSYIDEGEGFPLVLVHGFWVMQKCGDRKLMNLKNILE